MLLLGGGSIMASYRTLKSRATSLKDNRPPLSWRSFASGLDMQEPVCCAKTPVFVTGAVITVKLWGGHQSGARKSNFWGLLESWAPSLTNASTMPRPSGQAGITVKDPDQPRPFPARSQCILAAPSPCGAKDIGLQVA